jgi:hypothetical protein
MSSNEVKHEKHGNRPHGWEELIVYSESAIQAYTEKIKSMRKSLSFFKKQADMGMPFPSPSGTNIKKTS